MLSDWVDVCLIMVLVVVCVWLSECVMTLSDRAECELMQIGSMRVCAKVVQVCVSWLECAYVCSRALHFMHIDVNCSCGFCWTLNRHVVVFFSSRFMFRRSAMESFSMVTFTPVIFSVRLFHTPPFSFPPPPRQQCPLLFHPPLRCPLCAFCCRSLCPFLSFCFFPSSCPFSLATGQRRNCNVYKTL